MTSRRLLPDELRALAWLPSDDRPDEWVTPGDLAALLAATFGHRFTAETTGRLLGVLRREGMAVRRRRDEGLPDAYRRSPSGSRYLIAHGEVTAR